MRKPCDLEAAWLSDEREWCPIGRWKAFERVFPHQTETAPDIDPPQFTPPNITPRKSACVATVAIGPQSEELLGFTGPRMADYADRIGAEFVALTDDQFPAFRIGNKFRLEMLGNIYERVIFLDVDVWLSATMPNFLRLDSERVWWHSDHPHLPAYSFFDHDCYLIEKSQAIEIPDRMHIYNTGVVVYSSHHAAMWRPPRYAFEGTHTFEQTLVEVQAINAGFKMGRLPWRFNYQYWMPIWDEGRTAHVYHLANMQHEKRMDWLTLASAGLAKSHQRPSGVTET